MLRVWDSMVLTLRRELVGDVGVAFAGLYERGDLALARRERVDAFGVARDGPAAAPGAHAEVAQLAGGLIEEALRSEALELLGGLFERGHAALAVARLGQRGPFERAGARRLQRRGADSGGPAGRGGGVVVSPGGARGAT